VKTLISEGNKVDVISLDLSDLSKVEETLKNTFDRLDWESYAKFYLFNNAGDLGNQVKSVREIKDYASVKYAVDFNFTSYFIITSMFLARCRNIVVKRPTNTKPFVILINISSLAAIEPFTAWSIYCTPKAARDMLMRTIAAEEDPAFVKTLNWAPGVMHTELQDRYLSSDNAEENPSKQFISEVMKRGIATPTHLSAQALFEVLQKNDYKSGSHIDLYDVKPELSIKL